VKRDVRPALWLVLVAMAIVISAQFAGGLGRKLNLVVACLCVVVGVTAGVGLWLNRKGS
jgi:uncharacterized iron-regulated membrane protein